VTTGREPDFPIRRPSPSIDVEGAPRAAPPPVALPGCGPRPFLRAMIDGLARAGVPLPRIRYEFFGPADELLAA
jgi:ferredoxin-NADP reductase